MNNQINYEKVAEILLNASYNFQYSERVVEATLNEHVADFETAIRGMETTELINLIKEELDQQFVELVEEGFGSDNLEVYAAKYVVHPLASKLLYNIGKRIQYESAILILHASPFR
jgi:hypothetical protein